MYSMFFILFHVFLHVFFVHIGSLSANKNVFCVVFFTSALFPPLFFIIFLKPVGAKPPQTFLEMYLARRSNLKLLVLLADSRREPLASDAGVLEYAEDRENRPYKILMVATKVKIRGLIYRTLPFLFHVYICNMLLIPDIIWFCKWYVWGGKPRLVCTVRFLA